MLVLCLAGAAPPVAGHDGQDGAPAPVSEPRPAPGYFPPDFEPPQPGSYRLPPLFAAGDGEVLDENGLPLRLHSLLGDRAVVLSFVYTGCSDLNGCPLAIHVLQKLARSLAADPGLGEQVRLISLSFDPINDTPAVMRGYGERIQPLSPALRRLPDWRFLTTASSAELAPLLAAYDQALVPEPAPEGAAPGAFAHPLRVYLIDRQRRVRNVYSASFLHADLLVNDLRTLAQADPRRPTATPVAASAAAALLGPGDDKTGYASPDYRTRARDLSARRGQPADLLALVRDPPLGLPPVPLPVQDPPTRAKIALGRKLFFDRRLSLNETFSCAMCHIPQQGFTSNELATAVGIEGRTVRRNSPTLLNVAYLGPLFWDGRESALEQQVWGPLLASNEMGNPSVGQVIDKLRGLADYAGLFEAAFEGSGPGMETLGRALAAYQRTLLAADSPFDRWRFAGDLDALDAQARRGFDLFTGKAGCSGCHLVGTQHALFTDNLLHNTGVGYRRSMQEPAPSRRITVAPGVTLDVARSIIEGVGEAPPNDLGRYEISLDPADRWRYRTPSLRNVTLTAPYMHDGSIGTLEEVVEFYDRGGAPNPLLSPRIRPLQLDAAERSQLVAFLRALTGTNVAQLVADAMAAPIGDRRLQSASKSTDNSGSGPKP